MTSVISQAALRLKSQGGEGSYAIGIQSERERRDEYSTRESARDQYVTVHRKEPLQSGPTHGTQSYPIREGPTPHADRRGSRQPSREKRTKCIPIDTQSWCSCSGHQPVDPDSTTHGDVRPLACLIGRIRSK